MGKFDFKARSQRVLAEANLAAKKTGDTTLVQHIPTLLQPAVSLPLAVFELGTPLSRIRAGWDDLATTIEGFLLQIRQSYETKTAALKTSRANAGDWRTVLANAAVPQGDQDLLRDVDDCVARLEAGENVDSAKIYDLIRRQQHSANRSIHEAQTITADLRILALDREIKDKTETYEQPREQVERGLTQLRLTRRLNSWIRSIISALVYFLFFMLGFVFDDDIESRIDAVISLELGAVAALIVLLIIIDLLKSAFVAKIVDPWLARRERATTEDEMMKLCILSARTRILISEVNAL